MSEVVMVFAALFALGMIGLGLAVFVKGAREMSDTPSAWPSLPPTELS